MASFGRQPLFASAADSRHPTSPSASEAFSERLPERTVGLGGKRPNWFKAALAAGKKPEELLPKAGS